MYTVRVVAEETPESSHGSVNTFPHSETRRLGVCVGKLTQGQKRALYFIRIPLEAWISVCVYSVCVVLFAGKGLAKGWFPVRRVLPTVSRLRNWKSGQVPQGLDSHRQIDWMDQVDDETNGLQVWIRQREQGNIRNVWKEAVLCDWRLLLQPLHSHHYLKELVALIEFGA
jgi:hypothetical protein